MRSTLAVLLLVGGLIAGCSSRGHTDNHYNDQHMTDRHAGDRDRVDTPSNIDNRDAWNRLHSDPVCGMTVNPKTAYTQWYDGAVYYFDSDRCRRCFHDNRTAYVPGYEDRRVADDRTRETRNTYADPVCGATVDPKTGFKETYNGTTYWFESEDCRRQFHKNPSAYVPVPPKEVR